MPAQEQALPLWFNTLWLFNPHFANAWGVTGIANRSQQTILRNQIYRSKPLGKVVCIPTPNKRS